MSQQQVYDVLREKKSALTSKQIYTSLKKKGIKISYGTTKVNLRKMTQGDNPEILRFDEFKKSPRYVLIEYATEEQLRKKPSWLH